MEIEFKMAKRPDSQNNILKHILTLYRHGRIIMDGEPEELDQEKLQATMSL